MFKKIFRCLILSKHYITLGHYRSDSAYPKKKGIDFWSFVVAAGKPCMFYFKTNSRSETQEVKVMAR